MRKLVAVIAPVVIAFSIGGCGTPNYNGVGSFKIAGIVSDTADESLRFKLGFDPSQNREGWIAANAPSDEYFKNNRTIFASYTRQDDGQITTLTPGVVKDETCQNLKLSALKEGDIVVIKGQLYSNYRPAYGSGSPTQPVFFVIYKTTKWPNQPENGSVPKPDQNCD